MLRVLRIPAFVAVLALLLIAGLQGGAVAPGNPAFQRTWERTDRLVLDGTVARTWMWGPEANTGPIQELYAESPNGTRIVQYYDKSRMEITDPAADPNTVWYVTNGLLVVELMSGRLQRGHNNFEQHPSAAVNVAGDSDDAQGITYATLAGLRTAPPVADGATIVQRVSANGSVTIDGSLAGLGVTAAQRVQVPGIDHQIASPFWTFMNSSGLVWENGAAQTAALFVDPYYATGYPVTEAYWANVKVAGTRRDVLVQCFERRCLTYTPGNPDGFLTEAGNVGQHYHHWRYVQIPGEGNPTPTSITTPDTTTDYTYAGQWGEVYELVAPLGEPFGVAVDSENNVWVADTVEDRFVQFDENGIYLRSIGVAGVNPGEFFDPNDLDISADGSLYFLDTNNNRIQVFNANGVYQFQWGSSGAGNGQLALPSCLTIRGAMVYVCDFYNHRIQMFDLAGVYQGQFGSLGAAPGQFNYPAVLATDGSGALYVTDWNNHRVQKFDADGNYLSQFGAPGVNAGQFNNPWGIDIDAAGFIYVADSANHRIQKFTSAGAYVTQWGSNGSGDGEFAFPLGIAIDHDGDIYVADLDNDRVQKLTSAGEPLFAVHDTRRGRFNIPSDVTVEPGGNLLVVDGYVDVPTISRYTPSGAPLDTYGRKGTGAGEFDYAYGVAVNVLGDIYVTDAASNRVQHFESDWSYIGGWGATGTGTSQFDGPTDIAIDADGHVYVADLRNDRVQKFDASGQFLDQWGSFGAGPGQFDGPDSIAIDGERVYVTDFGNSRVQVFDRDGNYLQQWGSAGSATGQLDGPMGIAVNPGGYVLVVDSGNNRVQVFTPSGIAVGSFGAFGSGPGQFDVPFAIAVDAAGAVYVTDTANFRVQKFVPVE